MSFPFRLRYPAVWLFASARVLAAADGTVIYPAGSPAGASAGGSASQLGGALGPLTLVVALFLALAGGWVLWRQRTNRAVGGRDSRLLAVDETRALGNRQYLVVASYDGKKFLLGVCPGRIEMLSPLGESARDGNRIP